MGVFTKSGSDNNGGAGEPRNTSKTTADVATTGQPRAVDQTAADRDRGRLTERLIREQKNG